MSKDETYIRMEQVIYRDGITEKERYIFDIVDNLLNGKNILMEDMVDGLKHIRQVVVPNSRFFECDECQETHESTQ